MRKIMIKKLKLLQMQEKKSVIITTSISGRGVDIKLGGKDADKLSLEMR